jgi:apolipoprotein N-acyltransferase
MATGEKILKLKRRVLTWRNGVHLGLATASVLLYSALYPPVEWTGLAVVALVPWLVMVTRTSGKEQFAISYLAGVGYYLLNVYWLAPVTLPGYISMAMSFALYWPFAGLLIQKFHRRWSLPLFVAVPLVWVSLEWIRSWMITGFPWFFLGHSQATTLSMIQIADLGGAYAVSFVLAMANGAAAELILAVKDRRVRRAIPAVSIAMLMIVATIVYGQWRLRQNTLRPGPVVSVVQDDFPMFVEGEAAGVYDIFEGYLQASFPVMEHKPDMIVWPETCVGCSVNPEFLNANTEKTFYKNEQPHSRMFAETLAELAKKMNSYVVVGAISKEINPPGHYPEVDKFNSAVIYDRDGKYLDRYDKIRLVLFGEVVPFRYSCPPVYRFLNENMTPWGKDGFEYSLTPGRELKRFTMKTPTGEYRYSVAICYEDTMAGLIRNFVRPRDGEKQIDFLVNISNDGWFNHSCELPQHFNICVFRAVENRIAVARSVNTGISGFISPTGQIEGMVRCGSRTYGPGIRGAETRRLKLDSRSTVYSRIGDWPVIGMTVLVVLGGVVRKKKKDLSHE